jgi:hypothetical protein
MKGRKDKEYKHFANDDPTKFDQEKTIDLAKKVIKNSNL